MTVTATSYTPLTYNGNGSTSVFNITFQFYEVAVIHIDSSGSETEWTENTHYTVTGGEGSTGSITATPTVPATGEKLRIERRTSKDQPRDYDLDNAVLEAALQQSDDRLAMILQELDYDNRRRPAISKTNFTAAVEFPAASTGSVLSWASDGNLANTALLNLDGVAISALTPATSFEDTDILPIYDNSAGDNAGITWANVKTALGDLASKNTVSTEDLDDGVNTTAKYADGSITTAKYADGSITKAKLHADYNQLPLLHIQDQKPSNTDGGTFTSGAWRTRDLNAILTNQITGASLSSNQITLPVGSYRVKASAPSYNSESHRLRLYDVTNTTELLLGTSEYSRNIYAGSTRAFLSGRINLTSQSTIELQHRCANTTSSEGFGIGNGFGTEIYSEIEIYEVA